MAQDRFVHWPKKLHPSKDEIRLVLEGYLGPSGIVEDMPAGFCATIPGKSSDALRRVRGEEFPYRSERWFEVYVGDDNIDVITREQDQFMNALAQGFAKLCVEWWGVA